MNIYEGENRFQVVKRGENSYYQYVGKRGKVVDFGITVDRHPDAFSVSWYTNLNCDEFLKHACELIDAVATIKPTYRPMETGNSLTVISVSPKEADEDGVIRGRAHLAGSYSDQNYNNVEIMWGGTPEFALLTFEHTGWPLNRRDLDKAIALGLGGGDRFQVSNDHFIRINAEFCTVMFNGEPGMFSFWSHVPAIEALTRAYQATTAHPGATEKFRDSVNLLVSPKFAQNLR